MSERTRIERFIETYPIQFRDEFQELLTRLDKGEIDRKKVEEILKVKIGMALNMIKPEKEEFYV